MGSCSLIRHLGDRLYKSKFDALVNPLGTFSPVSATQLMDVLHSGTKITEEKTLQGMVFLYILFFTTRFNHNASGMLHLNTALDQARNFLEKATCVFSHPGHMGIWKSSICFHCFQLPQTAIRWLKRLVTLEESKTAILAFANSLKLTESNCQIDTYPESCAPPQRWLWKQPVE